MMQVWPPSGRCFWYACLASLFLATSLHGCGDAGNINVNASNPDNDIPVPTGPTGPAGDPETVVINEIYPDTSQIELYNPTSASVDISGFWLCHTTPGLIYAQMPDNTVIEPGGFLVVNWGIDGRNVENEIFTFPTVPIPLNVGHGEVGFYVPFGFSEDNFANSDLLRDYVQWGEADHFRQGVAVGAGIWPNSAFVPPPPTGQSFSFIGRGNTPDAWTATLPTIGIENNIP